MPDRRAPIVSELRDCGLPRPAASRSSSCRIFRDRRRCVFLWEDTNIWAFAWAERDLDRGAGSVDRFPSAISATWRRSTPERALHGDSPWRCRPSPGATACRRASLVTQCWRILVGDPGEPARPVLRGGRRDRYARYGLADLAPISFFAGAARRGGRPSSPPAIDAASWQRFRSGSGSRRIMLSFDEQRLLSGDRPGGLA